MASFTLVALIQIVPLVYVDSGGRQQLLRRAALPPWRVGDLPGGVALIQVFAVGGIWTTTIANLPVRSGRQ
jgi:hypothetical protein